MKNIFKSIFSLSFIDDASQKPQAFERAKIAVQNFYYLQVPIAFINLMKIGAVDPERSGFLPIWPMTWAGSMPYSDTAKIVAIFYVAVALLSCIFWNKRISKILVFLGIFQVHALDSSFGYINHFYYLLLYACFIFMFLPNTKHNENFNIETAKKFLVVYWGALAAILMTYTLSGMWKIYWGVVTIIAGIPGSFSPYTFSEHVAKKTIIESRDYFFSDFVISNPFLVWFSYLGTIYLEFFSIWVAFKPNLYKIWGLVLIFLHVGILLVMGIPFFESLLVLCILMLNSPFTEGFPTIPQIISDLPLVGNVWRMFRKKLAY